MRAPGWKGTVWYPSSNYSLQILISQIHQIFKYAAYPLRKNISFPKMPINHPKIYTKRLNSGYAYKHGDLALLEHERDIGRKAIDNFTHRLMF